MQFACTQNDVQNDAFILSSHEKVPKLAPIYPEIQAEALKAFYLMIFYFFYFLEFENKLYKV